MHATSTPRQSRSAGRAGPPHDHSVSSPYHHLPRNDGAEPTVYFYRHNRGQVSYKNARSEVAAWSDTVWTWESTASPYHPPAAIPIQPEPVPGIRQGNHDKRPVDGVAVAINHGRTHIPVLDEQGSSYGSAVCRQY